MKTRWYVYLDGKLADVINANDGMSESQVRGLLASNGKLDDRFVVSKLKLNEANIDDLDMDKKLSLLREGIDSCIDELRIGLEQFKKELK